MATWAFEAKDHAGKQIRGTREAPDRQTALEDLRNEGLFLTRLEATSARTSAPKAKSPQPAAKPQTPSRQAGGGPAVAPPRMQSGYTPGSQAAGRPSMQDAPEPIAPRPLVRASSKNLSIYFGQMASMIHAGTSLGQALNLMGQNATSPALREVSKEMAVRTQKGETLSVCMEAYPGLFTPLHVGMIKAGERGGFLEQMFYRLSGYCERDFQLQTTIKRETLYPKIVLFCALVIPAVPVLVLQGFWPFVVQISVPFLVIGSLYILFRMAKFAAPLALHQKNLNALLDGAKLSLPGVSKVTRALASAKFARAMGALYSAGVGPGESIRLAADACGNETMARSVRGVIPQINNGASLAESLISTRHFPQMVEQMLRVGEQSGLMDEQLEKAADFLETESETAIRQATMILGVVAFLAVAAYVGSIIVHFYAGHVNDIMHEMDQ